MDNIVNIPSSMKPEDGRFGSGPSKIRPEQVDALERGGKTLLYALDTGGYDDEMRAVLSRFCFDAVVLEGTCGLTRRDPGGHMNAQKDREMVRYLESHGLLRAGARVYLSHLSPHWAPPHDAYAPMMAAEGMTVAYDGLTVRV